MELVDKYRPRKLSQIIGQETAVKTITNWIQKEEIPKVTLFTGPSGCGKTTMCRILKKVLKCVGSDYKELNASIERGIDTIREIRNHVNAYGINGDSRVWVIDEAHGLTKDAQNSLLKVMEDATEGRPDHAYFMLCTTEPTKLLKTVMTRCNEVKIKAVKEKDLCRLLASVIEQEMDSKEYPPDEVLERIAECSEGSPRKALKILQQVINLSTVDEMMEAIQASDYRNAAFDLVKVLIPFKGKPQWNQVAKVLNGLKDEDPEGIRRLILSVCRSHMLKGGPLAFRAFAVYGHFQDAYYETGITGLVASCFGAANM